MRRASGADEDARLRAIKAAQCAAARSRILAGELDEASRHLGQAELVERLGRLGPRGQPRAPILALAAIGACGLLVFASWKAKLSSFADLEVSIHAETTAAQVTLGRPAVFESLRGSAVDVARLSSLAAQISELPGGAATDRWVRVQGAPVDVKGLRAAQDVGLDFGLLAVPDRAPTLVLRAHGKGVSGDLLVRPGALVSGGESDGTDAPPYRLQGDVLDVVSFGCDDCVDTPLRLDLREVEPFAFGDVPVSGLGFAAERAHPDGTIYFTSGLRAGSIRVLAADRSETIEAGDSLKLDVAEARRFQIGRAARQDTLSFVYEGTVKRLSLGPQGAERDLSPSVLESLYRQKALALLWGSAVFLWGVFTGLRRLWLMRSG